MGFSCDDPEKFKKYAKLGVICIVAATRFDPEKAVLGALAGQAVKEAFMMRKGWSLQSAPEGTKNDLIRRLIQCRTGRALE